MTVTNNVLSDTINKYTYIQFPTSLMPGVTNYFHQTSL